MNAPPNAERRPGARAANLQITLTEHHKSSPLDLPRQRARRAALRYALDAHQRGDLGAARLARWLAGEEA